MIATIRCLYRDGYSATTIDAVMAEAGVSRGGLQHHFPTRVDLMLAVGRYVWAFDRRAFEMFNRRQPDPPVRLRQAVLFLWKLISRRSGVAVLEILVACRSDRSLAEAFVPEHQRVQSVAIDGTRAVLAAADIADLIDADAFHRFSEACMRGLAIDRTFNTSLGDTPAALSYLMDALEVALRKAAIQSD